MTIENNHQTKMGEHLISGGIDALIIIAAQQFSNLINSTESNMMTLDSLLMLISLFGLVQLGYNTTKFIQHTIADIRS